MALKCVLALWVLLLMLPMAIVIGAYAGTETRNIVLIIAVLGWCAACFRGYRQLDGMSGDISGYAITVGEACAVIAFALI